MNAKNILTKPAHQKNSDKYSLKAQTLIESLYKRTEEESDFLIFIDTRNREHKVSAGDTINGAMAIAQFLSKKGLRKNDKVTIMLPTGVEFLFTYYGVLMAGGIPVPVSQPAGTNNLDKYLDNLSHIVKDSESVFFITYDKMKKIIGGVKEKSFEFIFNSDFAEKAVPESEYTTLPAVDIDDIALIQYTSGTTGKPKGVILTHGNLLHNTHGIGAASEITTKDVGISWLPMYHDMGLIGGLFTSIYWSIPMVLMLPEVFLFKPHWWLQNIDKYRATMTVSPNFGYHYCVSRIPDDMVNEIDLSSLRLALNGAEPIDRVTLKKFIEKFRPSGLSDEIFLPCYGMAENSLAATFPSMDATTVVRRFNRNKLEEDHVAIDSDSSNTREYIDLVSVGYPLVGQEIRIADESGRTLKERQVGQILVKSPSMTRGYYKNQAATNEAIKDGWLYTGDLGFILEGQLYISGRIKEVIIKRGKNIYPYDVERVASTVNGVRLGCLAAFAVENDERGTEDIVLVCETVEKDHSRKEEIRKEIQKEVLARLGVSLDDIKLVPKGTIPKTTSGKIQRIYCKKIYLNEAFMKKPHETLLLIAKTVIKSYRHLWGMKIKNMFKREK